MAKPVDTLIVKLVNPAGEEISWHAVPMARLEGPVEAEPSDEEDEAFLAELRGDDGR